MAWVGQSVREAGGPASLRIRLRSDDGAEHPSEAHHVALGVPGEVGEHRLSLDHVRGERTPEAAVEAVVAVVAHHEEVARRYAIRAEVVAGADLAGKNPGSVVDRVGLVSPLSIHIEHLVPDFDGLASHRDAALDEILAGVHRIAEHDDVPGLRTPESGEAMIEVAMPPESDVDLRSV